MNKSQPAQRTSPCRLDAFNYHHRLRECRGLALVIFTAPACGACRSWLQMLGAYRRQRPEIMIFEVDTEQDIALAREFDVHHLPALFLYQDGLFHAAIACAATPDKLNGAIKAALEQPAEDAP